MKNLGPHRDFDPAATARNAAERICPRSCERDTLPTFRQQFPKRLVARNLAGAILVGSACVGFWHVYRYRGRSRRVRPRRVHNGLVSPKAWRILRMTATAPARATAAALLAGAARKSSGAWVGVAVRIRVRLSLRG